MDDKEPRKVDIGAPLSVETIYQLAILAVVFLLTACSNDPGASQPTQKAVAVAEPTEVPTLVASPLPTVPPTEPPTALPTEVPAETPTEVSVNQVPPTQVRSNGKMLEVHIDCGENRRFVGEDIECGLDSDSAERVNWTAVGGSPDYSDGVKSFSTRYDSAGKYTIVLEVCNQTGCVTETHELNIIIREPTSGERATEEQSSDDTSSATASQWSPFNTDTRECSKENNMLTSLPISPDTGYDILPMGKISGRSHITPTDHWYFDVDVVDDEPVEVLAPASGYIVQIDRWDDDEALGDYRMVFEHSCTLFSYYIHLREIDPAILKELGELRHGQSIFPRIPVSSGQPIGEVGPLLSYQRIHNQTNLDFALIDTKTTLPGFIIPSHYEEAWKIHTVDPFDYYEEPLRSQLLERNLRDVELSRMLNLPVGGKIDFDIDGKLVGNWFLDGTETYFGKGVAGKSKADWDQIYGRDVGDCESEYWDEMTGQTAGAVPCNYWLGHLTFAYDSIQPDQIKISMAVFWDSEEGGSPWRVKNNDLDPASIDVETGIAKYEIFTDYENQVESEPFDIVGTLLVQMIDDRAIRIEVFLGQNTEDVNKFTEKARIYRR